MKPANGLKAHPVFLDFGLESLRANHGGQHLEVPLTRSIDGSLTDACQQELVAALQKFVRRKFWQPAVRGLCAIPARGVSLRTFSIPTAKPEETERLLALQIENEFPLTPQELAWGWSPVDVQPGAEKPTRTIVVMAVKKDVVEPYAALFAQCGIAPEFTLGALARSYSLKAPIASRCFLDVGQTHSEFIRFEDNVPTLVRVLPWGLRHISKQNVSDAAQRKAGLDCLSAALKELCTTGKFYVSGLPANEATLIAELQTQAGKNFQCETLAANGAVSATLAGLEQNFETGKESLTFRTATAASRRATKVQPIALQKRVLVAGALVLGLLMLPYLEALVLTPHLRHQLATVEAEKGKLAVIDRELSFLQNLKQTQPPHLDALYLLSKSAPSGTRVDSLSMNRRGEVVLRASLQNGQQVSDFRGKLMESGFFSVVTVEEQVPTPDRQKVNIRMTAQWKSVAERMALAIGPNAEEMAKDKTDKSKGDRPPGRSTKPQEKKP